MVIVALWMLDLAGEVLEECFAIAEVGDGLALVPLAAEFLDGAGVRMRGEGMRECGVVAEDAGDAIRIVGQRRGCSVDGRLGLFEDGGDIAAVLGGESGDDSQAREASGLCKRGGVEVVKMRLMKTAGGPNAAAFDVWHLDVELAANAKPLRGLFEGLDRMLEMLGDVEERDEIEAARLHACLGETADLHRDAEHIARVFGIADVWLDATRLMTELAQDEDKFAAAGAEVEHARSRNEQRHEMTHAVLGDLAGAVGVLQPRLPSLLVSHAVAFAVKVVDLRGIRPRIGEDESAVFTDDASQRLPVAIFARHYGEVRAVAEFAMLDGGGTEGVEWHVVGVGRKVDVAAAQG